MDPKIHVTAENPSDALKQFRVERYELRALRRILVGAKHVVAIDINGAQLRIDGIGAPDPEIKDLMKLAGASFDPMNVHDSPADGEEREYKVVRADPWGHDRVL